MHADSLTLAIEASNPSCTAGVAIGSRTGGLLGVEAVAAGDGRHDDLMSAIDRLAKRAGVGPRDIGRVAVSIGPGGYTALRIAVAAAKMMCEALRASCVAIPTARVVARRVKAEGSFAVMVTVGASAIFTVALEGLAML